MKIYLLEAIALSPEDYYIKGFYATRELAERDRLKEEYPNDFQVSEEDIVTE